MSAAPIIIVGGGIGGLAAAIAFARKRMPTVVIERAPQFVASEFDEVRMGLREAAQRLPDRGAPEAERLPRQVLERLRVDQIDLLQLHSLVNEDEWQVAMGPDGALRAAARVAGARPGSRADGVCGGDVVAAMSIVGSLRGYPKSQESLKRHWRLELPRRGDSGRLRVSGPGPNGSA